MTGSSYSVSQFDKKLIPYTFLQISNTKKLPFLVILVIAWSYFEGGGMQKVNYQVIFLVPKIYYRVTLECKLLIIEKNANHLFCILLMLYLMSFRFISAIF